MNYQPITDAKQKQEFIEWLRKMQADLNGAPEDQSVKNVFPASDTGDIGTAKDLVGNFLATLSGERVTID